MFITLDEPPTAGV